MIQGRTSSHNYSTSHRTSTGSSEPRTPSSNHFSSTQLPSMRGWRSGWLLLEGLSGSSRRYPSLNHPCQATTSITQRVRAIRCRVEGGRIATINVPLGGTCFLSVPSLSSLARDSLPNSPLAFDRFSQASSLGLNPGRAHRRSND